MNVASRLISVIAMLGLVAFIVYQVYGVIKDVRTRKKTKVNEESVQSDKQD